MKCDGRGFSALALLVAVSAAAVLAAAALPALAHSYRNAVLEREAENLLMDIRQMQSLQESAPAYSYVNGRNVSPIVMTIEAENYEIACAGDGGQKKTVLRTHRFPPHVTTGIVGSIEFSFNKNMALLRSTAYVFHIRWEDRPSECKYIIITKDGRIRMDNHDPDEDAYKHK